MSAGLMMTSRFVSKHTAEALTFAQSRLERQRRAPDMSSFFWRGGESGRKYRKEGASSFIKYSPININYSPWNWGGTTNYYENGSSSKKEREPSYFLPGAFGTIAAVGAATLLGMLYDNYQTICAEEQRVRFVKRAISQSQWDPAIPEEVKGPFKSLIETQLRIVQLETGKWTNYVVSAAGVMGGGASLAIGAVTATGFFIMAGHITWIASAILAALNFGMHYNDEEKQRLLLNKIVGVPGLGIGYVDLIKKALHPTTFTMTHPITSATIGSGSTAELTSQIDGAGNGLSHLEITERKDADAKKKRLIDEVD